MFNLVVTSVFFITAIGKLIWTSGNDGHFKLINTYISLFYKLSNFSACLYVCMYESINLLTAVSINGLITLCIEYSNIETNPTEGRLLDTEGHRHPSSSYNPKLKLTLNLTLTFDYINISINNQLDPINCVSENRKTGCHFQTVATIHLTYDFDIYSIRLLRNSKVT